MCNGPAVMDTMTYATLAAVVGRAAEANKHPIAPEVDFTPLDLIAFGAALKSSASSAITDIGFRKVSKHWLCLDTFSIHPCAVVTFHEPVPRRIEWLGKLVHEPLCGS